MRISCDKNDKAFCQVTHDVKVFLNKEEVRHVITADEELGIVIINVHSKTRKYFIIKHKSELRRLTLKGDVNIYLGPRTKRHLKFLKDNNLDKFGGKK